MQSLLGVPSPLVLSSTMSSTQSILYADRSDSARGEHHACPEKSCAVNASFNAAVSDQAVTQGVVAVPLVDVLQLLSLA
jgi:hypothetical protein